MKRCSTSASVRCAVEELTLENDIAAYFLGICQDFKYFGFAMSVLILNEDCTKIVRLLRKEGCYCRFTLAGEFEAWRCEAGTSETRCNTMQHDEKYLLINQDFAGNRKDKSGEKLAESEVIGLQLS